MSDQQQCSGTPDMTPGIVSWNELVSRDPEASKKFYSQLFGWQIQTMPMGGFAIISGPQGAGIGLWEFTKPA